MNKILMDGDKIILDNSNYNLEVKGMAKIYIYNIERDIDINIHLCDNARLEMFDFNKSKLNKNIKVVQDNNSYFNYVHTFKIKDEYNLNYKAVLLGNNNINNVNISGVSNGIVSFNIDGYALDNTKDNELNENIKILTIDGKAYISPMLHVSTKEVIANHNTAISNVREDELFYLKSKGIDEKSSISLISDGYIYGYLKKYDEEILNLINE